MKLLVLDVEGTLFKTEIRLPGAGFYSTIWQAIAARLGPEAVSEEIATHGRWKNGGYKGYIDWMRATIAIHLKYGLSKSSFEEIIISAKYNDGVLETLANIDRKQYEIVLVSGGFRELAWRVQRALNISHAFTACEYSFSENGRLENYNLLPCDFEGKLVFVRLMLSEYALRPGDWIFVGDGPNDAQIARAAPISVGYRPHPDLDKIVTFRINDFTELTPILARHEKAS